MAKLVGTIPGEIKKLITKTAQAQYTKTKESSQHDFFAESIKHLGHHEEIKALRNKKLNLFKKKSIKTFPALKATKALQNKANSLLDKSNWSLFGPSNDLIDGILVTDIDTFSDWTLVDEPVARFTPPYLFGEVYSEILVDVFDQVTDQSYYDATSGLISNQVATKQSEDGWGSYHPGGAYVSYVSVGVNYTMPATGIIQVDLLLQNTYNRQYASLEDFFGFSEGRVSLWQSIFLSVLHPNNTHDSEINLAFLEIESDGDDTSKTQSDLITTSNYGLRLQSTGSFPAGTNLQILVGSFITITSALDDMEGISNNEFNWFVRSINVRTI